MRDVLILFLHLIVTVVRLAPPGGLRSVVAESLLVKHQLRILNRGRKRAPNLRAAERIIAGLCTLFMNPARVLRSAIVLKPSTLLHLHRVLANRKYNMLLSRKRRRPPGPKGPHKELIDAVVELKRRNLNWGCPRIAQQITLAFGVAIDKDVVRRILSVHYWPESDSGSPSWLTFLGHMKDSLWSMDLFRCESASLRTHWVLVVMDQYSRRIIGFGVHAGTVDGVALCRMFNRAIRWQLKIPGTSAPTMISCIVSISGWPTSACWRWQKSRRCPMCLYPIRLSSGSSGPYAENAWTACYSGPPSTWRPSYSIFNIIIMSIERKPDAKGTRR